MGNRTPLIPDSSAQVSEAELPAAIHLAEITASRSLSAEATKHFYVPELDSLRFLAFLAVFVFHSRSYLPYAGLPYTLEKIIRAMDGTGAFGVDLFFVLSAYLITELLLKEKKATWSLDVPAFYLRRILRIWPLYFFFLAVAALLPLFDPTQHLGIKYLAGYSFLSGNWMFVLGGVPESVATPLWSIS